MMKKTLYTPFIIIFVLFVLCSCSAKTIKIDQTMNKQQISLKQGQTLALRLDGNPTTGYQWAVDQLDESILASAGDPEYKSDSMLIGAGGIYTFNFYAVNLGETIVRLKYAREFENEAPPVDTFEIHVVVE